MQDSLTFFSKKKKKEKGKRKKRKKREKKKEEERRKRLQGPAVDASLCNDCNTSTSQLSIVKTYFSARSLHSFTILGAGWSSRQIFRLERKKKEYLTERFILESTSLHRLRPERRVNCLSWRPATKKCHSSAGPSLERRETVVSSVRTYGRHCSRRIMRVLFNSVPPRR